MENQAQDFIPDRPCVKASFGLGSETYAVNAGVEGSLSEELVSVKEKSMAILKDYITKHNAPTEIPDDLVEGSSDDDEDEVIEDRPSVKSKKSKLA